MTDRIEYAWIEPDAATGEPLIAKTEFKGGRLRVRSETVAQAETRPYEADWTDGGRTGRIVGRLHVDALVLPAEVRTGPDGRPVVRPIETAQEPVPGPGQRLVGPLYRIGPETVTRYWDVEDRPLDELRAERVAEIKAEMVDRINDRLLEVDEAGDIRAAGRAALMAIAAAETAQAIAEVAVTWPSGDAIKV